MGSLIPSEVNFLSFSIYQLVSLRLYKTSKGLTMGGGWPWLAYQQSNKNCCRTTAYNTDVESRVLRSRVGLT